MIRLAGHEPEVRASYLAGLNHCFPGWGGRAHFDWCYGRPDDPRPADILVAEFTGEIVAGLAIVYRWIGRDEEPRELVGLMSGAWTLPNARGQGLFGCLLDRAAVIARARGASMALAFVTGERGSVGQLKARSERVIDGGLFSRTYTGESVALRKDLTVLADAAATAFANRLDRRGQVAILHARQSWMTQMLRRTAFSQVVRLAETTLFALEQHSEGWSVLDTLPEKTGPVSDYALTTSTFARRFTTYTLHAAEFAKHAGEEWTQTNARMFLMPLAASRYIDGDWHVPGGDRM